MHRLLLLTSWAYFFLIQVQHQTCTVSAIFIKCKCLFNIKICTSQTRTIQGILSIQANFYKIQITVLHQICTSQTRTIQGILSIQANFYKIQITVLHQNLHQSNPHYSRYFVYPGKFLQNTNNCIAPKPAPVKPALFKVFCLSRQIFTKYK